MALTLRDLKALEPSEEPHKRHDSLGLFALVAPTGSILWRYKYSLAGHTNTIALGP